MLKFWTGFSLFLASAVLFVDVEYAGLSGIALSILLLIVAAAMSLCFRAAQPKEKLTFELDGVLIPKVGFVQWSEIAEIQTEKVHYITVLTVDGKKHHVSWIYLGKGWESILQFHREYA